MIKKIILGVACLSLFVALPTLASTMSGHEEAQNMITQKIECSNLSDDQLEKIGDYYMELMAPDQGHEVMDEMMGGEGSESLKQMHILIARRWYCGDAIGMGMMSMMTSNYSPNMMNEDTIQDNNQFSMFARNGMMNSSWGTNMMYGFANRSSWMIILYVLSIIFLITGIVAFVKYLFNKK